MTRSRRRSAAHVVLVLLVAGSLALQAAAAPTETGTTRPSADAGSIDSGMRFWLMIGLPGLLIGGAAMATVMILANRARRRKLERGELPEV